MLECVAPRATGARSCDDWGVGHGGGGESTGSSAADRMVWVSGPSPFAGRPAASLDSVLPVGKVEPVFGGQRDQPCRCRGGVDAAPVPGDSEPGVSHSHLGRDNRVCNCARYLGLMLAIGRRPSSKLPTDPCFPTTPEQQWAGNRVNEPANGCRAAR